MKKRILIALLFIVGVFMIGCATTKTTDVFRFEVRELELTLYSDANTKQENTPKPLKLIRGDIDDNAVIVYTTTILTGENAGKIDMNNGVIEVIGSNVNDKGYPTTKGEKDVVTINPIAAGSVRFSAYIEGQENVCDSIIITVVNEKMSAFQVSLPKDRMFIGEQLQLSSSALPSYLDADMYNFTSNDTQIATVDENGIVTGVKPGKTKITAYSKYDSSMFSSASIEVVYAASGAVKLYDESNALIASGSTLNVTSGETIKLIREVLPSDSTLTKNSVNQSVTCDFATKNIAKATIKAENGVNYIIIEALKAGTTDVTVKAADNKSSFKFTIEVSYDKSTDLALENDNFEIVVEKTAEVKATVSPASANPNVVITPKTDADAELVTITGTTIKGIAPGTATLVVSTIQPDESDPITKEIQVVVSYDTITSLTLSKKELTFTTLLDADAIALGHTITYSVKPSGSNKAVTYVSDNEAVATVDANGVVTINDVVGTATITVTSVDNAEIKDTLVITILPEASTIDVQGGKDSGSTYTNTDVIDLTVSITPNEALQDFKVEFEGEGNYEDCYDINGNQITIYFDSCPLGTFKITISCENSTGSLTWERTYTVIEEE